MYIDQSGMGRGERSVCCKLTTRRATSDDVALASEVESFDLVGDTERSHGWMMFVGTETGVSTEKRRA